jgi:hypothetical protein
MQDATPAKALEFAARLQEAVEHYDPDLIHSELGALRLGVSVGHSCYPDDSSDYASLLAIADTRMYKNKTDRKIRQLAQGQLPAVSSTTADGQSTALAETGIGLSDVDLNFSLVQSHPTRESHAAHIEIEQAHT